MEDKSPKEEEKKKDIKDTNINKSTRNKIERDDFPKIPNFPINKKIQNKLFKEYFKKHPKNSEEKKEEPTSKEDKKEITKKIIYQSGIIKTLTKNSKNKIINQVIDYQNLKPNYINNIKENVDQELIKLIENSFLLYNRRPIIRNIVKKPYSTKALEEKILLWKHYIKNLPKEEKAHIFRKLLYYIGKFSEKVYEELIQVKEIFEAYRLYLSKGKISRDKKESNMHYNEFYMFSELIGYDSDGNPEKDRDYSPYRSISAVMMFNQQTLNVRNELNGTGCGLIFLKELKEISEMYTNASYIFDPVFIECFNIFDKNSFFLFEELKTFRILWNFFVDYFIDDGFIRELLKDLKYIFGMYKQDDIVKLIHDLILYRYNIFDILSHVKKKLVKMIGPEEILDEKEKVENMKNIDDVLKYIEGDEKPKKKKKKKKKKNENKINMINQIEEDNGKNVNNSDNYDDVDIDDSLSIISEADSVLDSFKNDILEETQFNTGNKIIPQLSSQFLNQFQKK